MGSTLPARVVVDNYTVRTCPFQRVLADDVSYGREEVTKIELVDLGVLTFRRLREWKRDLPPSLQCNLADKSMRVTPHVLLLQ